MTEQSKEGGPPDGSQRQKWEVLATKVGAEHEADVILYSGPIEHEGADRIIKLSKRSSRRKNVLLLLTTRGGDADAGFRIARCLQDHYGKFSLYIYGRCKSAGTLVAVGANEIVLSDYGEFGPLDVQLGKQDELFESTSGLDVSQALISLNERTYNFFRETLVDLRLGSRSQISTKLAAEISSKLAVEVYGRIYGQIDPMQLGSVERAMRVAIRYGERLDRKNLKKGALERLATGYPSHSFVIDLAEARELLFEKIRAPSDDEEQLGECISHVTRDEPGVNEALVLLLNPPVPVVPKEPSDETPRPAREGPKADEGGGAADNEAVDSPASAPHAVGTPNGGNSSQRVRRERTPT